MLDHLPSTTRLPGRTVVLGASGFVGSAICQRLRQAGGDVVGFGSKELDLAAPDAATTLRGLLRDGDAVVLVSAKAPCKDVPTLLRNLAMVESCCGAIATTGVDHVVYVSSDAVYADDLNPVSERTWCQPASLHGMMHSARELMLRSSLKARLAILRPTLLYGVADPHNGYGPNRYRRDAARTGRITLFGEGEEKRDHVLVDDLAEIVLRCLERRSAGVLNVATGTSHSFRAAAELVASHFETPIEIVGTPRQNPVTHRHFDPTDAIKAFPDFQFTPLAVGIAETHRRAKESVG